VAEGADAPGGAPDFRPDFRHVRAWVFDLDNTLYPSECDLFAQIDARMRAWVARYLGVSEDEARAVQKRYYAEHGTTLKGLMANHGAIPNEYLDFVHDIDVSVVPPDAILRARIEALPGTRIVFTNGSEGHARRVLKQRGLEGVFDRMFDIVACGFEPKPARVAFERMMDACAVDPAASAMFEDLPRNLEAAHALGFTTVLVRTGHDWSHEPEGARPAGRGEAPACAHYVTDDLTHFLGEVLVRER
jgi:putative hydrolase of the HAD superfamily